MDKSFLTKMITPLLESVTLVEKITDRKWLQSDLRAEDSGIQKEEDKLRIDSRIQIRSTG